MFTDWFRKLLPQKPLPVIEQRFFCVRGYMKSGTNWVCNLLNLHPQIKCIGEFHWDRLLEPLQKNFDTLAVFRKEEKLKIDTLARLDRLIKESMIEAASSQTRWIGDRNPSAIEPQLFPGSPHFHIIRDGRDVLISRVFHLLNRPQVSYWFQHDLELQALLAKFQADPLYFQKCPDQLLRHEKIVRESARGWASLIKKNVEVLEAHPEISVMQLRYEEMHQNVELWRSKMYEFLGLNPTEANPLNATTTPGFEEAPNRFYRKGAVGDWQNYMTDNAKSWFNEEAGETLLSLGYAQSAKW
jgi:Sulfotransferase family